jgi:uncharacterized membrane-anchored protein
LPAPQADRHQKETRLARYREHGEPTPEEIEASLPPHINGPKLVDLGSNIEIDLPAGMVLFEHAEAKAMIEQSGGDGGNVRAAIARLDSDWLVLVEYEDVGYVSDKDADQLDANELFASYQQGNNQQNIRRKEMGIGELFLDGWSEMPRYDKTAHHLVWGLKGHSDSGQVINSFTRILGRNGYMSVNLIDSPDKIEASKQATAGLFAATRFTAGFTYADHAEGDKSSGMGLRALVLGGTGLAVMKVAKTGLLIKLLLVFKKVWWLVIVGIGGLFKLLLGRKKDDEVAGDSPTYAPPSSEAPPSDPELPPSSPT